MKKKLIKTRIGINKTEIPERINKAQEMFLKCVITLISLGRPDQREKKNRGDLQPISGMKRNITVDVSDGEPIREYYE